MSVVLQEVYQRLLDALGPQKWWPGDTPFEMMVGAILVQNTNWQNVERAIGNLRRGRPARSPRPARRVRGGIWRNSIRPAGYFRIKARRLRSLIDFLVERYDGSIWRHVPHAADELRQELLGIHGVGPETADSILLYAGGLPSFVVDAYTYRVFSRHAWIDPESDYHQIQEYFHDHLPADAPMFNEFHALWFTWANTTARRASRFASRVH